MNGKMGVANLLAITLLLSGCGTSTSGGPIEPFSIIGPGMNLVRYQYLVTEQQQGEEENMGEVLEQEEINIPEAQIDQGPIVPGNYDLSNIEYETKPKSESSINEKQIFPEEYSEIEGVLSFRGNNRRDAASFGRVEIKENALELLWSYKTGSRSWGGGAGWTGQPSIIKWPKEIREIMNIKDEFRQKENFVEVIYASLDGSVYFFDLESGKESRSPIDIKNPIKGSVALDPRGYPLLYVGQGIQESGEMGYRIFNLIDGKLLHFVNGKDSFAHRGWGAFDGSPVINRDTDTLVIGGENGIFYNIKLNTTFHMENRDIQVNPEILRYRYKIKGNGHQGIENSMAVYKNFAYFADNGGSIQAVDLTTMKPVWALDKLDDTDASITIEVEGDIPYLYTGTEVDKQGTKGNAYLRKIDGLTGEILWIKEYPCMSLQGDKPVNGGVLATNIVGKHAIEDQVVFTLARYGKFHSGLMIALDKRTGEEIWRWEMPNYAWSSPVSVYDHEGKAYILQCDSAGSLYLLEGKTGNILNKINLGANVEGSPAVFHDILVIATRGGKMLGIKLR